MNEVTSENKYLSLLTRFSQVQRTIDGANLQRYHSIGRLFSEFCHGLERQVWGAKTVQKLADDLQDNGVMSDIANPVRYLYWAKNVYDFDPAFEQLGELSERGFSVTHAKLLFSLNDEVREKMVKKLLQADKVLPSRELETELRLTAATDANIKTMELAKEAAPLDTASPSAASTSTPEAGKAPAAASTAGASSPTQDKTSSSDKTKKSKEKSDEPASPMKTLNKFEKLVSKLTVEVPDVFLAIKHVEKRGFDSDKAHENYKRLIADIKSTLRPAIGSLTEMEKLLHECDTDG